MTLAGFAQRLHEDGFRELFAESHASVAHLTDQTRMAADESNALFLAQTHFAKPIQHVGLHGELLDTNGRACFNARKRIGFHFGAAVAGSGWRGSWFRLFQGVQDNSVATSCKVGFDSARDYRQRITHVSRKKSRRRHASLQCGENLAPDL